MRARLLACVWPHHLGYVGSHEMPGLSLTPTEHIPARPKLHSDGNGSYGQRTSPWPKSLTRLPELRRSRDSEPPVCTRHASCSGASRVLVQMPHTTGLTVRGTYKHRLRRSFYTGQRSQRTEVLPPTDGLATHSSVKSKIK